jgi:hypothetical protein
VTAFSNLKTELLQRVNTPTGKQLTSAMAGNFINNALEDWTNTVEPLWRPYGFYVTANQFRYPLPSDHVKVKTLHWYQNGNFPLKPMTPKNFQRAGYFDWTSAAGRPEAYTIADNCLFIGPRPSTSSNTSTLNGSHTSSVTTISVVDGTQFHDGGGMILVDTEQILHQGISTNDLTLAVRGQAGTTAASHNTAATVYRLDLIMNYFYVPATLSAGADVPAIPQRWQKTMLHHAIAAALFQLGREDEAQIQMGLYEGKKLEAKREMRKVHRDESDSIYTPYY